MDTFEQFNRDFPTDEACKEYIVAKRWPDGVRCPRCNRKEKAYALKAPPFHWTCCNTDCGGRKGYRFSVTTATIFQDTKVSLRLWFKIGYLMLTAKKGISSLQIRRIIFGEHSGTDWRTAWYICHRWRAAMRGDAFPLTGVVEVDESGIGGKDKNRHWNKKQQVRGMSGKTTLIGAIIRKGDVVCQVIENTDAAPLNKFVRKAVSGSVDLVACNRWNGIKTDAV
jgi:hypothetical protein